MALAILGLLAGLPVGASGPLFVLVMSPFIAGGPTESGLALFVSACVSVTTGLIALLIRRGRWWVVPLFTGSAMLCLGILAGYRLGASLGLGD
jgi:uncharacterized membrane protein